MKVKNLRISIKPVYRVPIDGISVRSDTRADLKGLCDALGLEPEIGEEFTLYFETATMPTFKTWLINADIKDLRILLDEFSKRGVDLSDIEGMEDRYRMALGEVKP